MDNNSLKKTIRLGVFKGLREYSSAKYPLSIFNYKAKFLKNERNEIRL
ncbi:hypothetical protein HPSA50_0573 [Helicobacter pylori SouthAfrica50]|uniref:Uncharacterized protein n=1 Tax=Helicobacter pylori SouthAfrica50 TaxID=1352357 RepID=T2SCT2_HELPX|nr:hypothetical protein HPSA50_0573 [Helicobacter pylori SouthAfrica50]